MIPIKYDLSDRAVRQALYHYMRFLVDFRKRLRKSISNQQVGNRTKKGDIDTTCYLRGADLDLFKWIDAHFKLIVFMDARFLPRFIDHMQNVKGVSKDKTATTYKCLYHLFVDEGFNLLPKEQIVKAVNVDACPYCNRGDAGDAVETKIIDGVQKEVHNKGNLDHFYAKEYYPYLAITLTNLVPSCPTCNQYPQKYTEDAKETGLVNPYTLHDPDGMCFKIDVSPWGAPASKDNARITTNCPNAFMTQNVTTFSIESLYNTHELHEAIGVYNVYNKSHNQHYIDGVTKVTKDLQTTVITDYSIFKEALGVVGDKELYKSRKLSKMKTDIWFQLENGL